MPANQIVRLLPGELFVHRNIANLVVHSDLNCLSVLQYAVEVLHVEDLIVCGHYGCGGIRAAASGARLGLIDNWLRVVRAIEERHRAILDTVDDREDCLCELSVLEQARNVGNTAIVQDAWQRGQSLTIHAWIYALHDGLLRDLGFAVGSPDLLDRDYRDAVSAVAERRRSHS